MFTWGPAAPPNSAPYLFRCTLNSPIASTDGKTRIGPLQPTALFVGPSTVLQYVQGHALDDRRLEPADGHLDRVVPDLKLGERIHARGVGHRGARDARVLAPHRHVRARNHGPRGVGHGAAYGGGDLLGERW